MRPTDFQPSRVGEGFLIRGTGLLVMLVLALTLVACGGGTTPAPTIGPDATSSVAPAATGTPLASKRGLGVGRSHRACPFSRR